MDGGLLGCAGEAEFLRQALEVRFEPESAARSAPPARHACTANSGSKRTSSAWRRNSASPAQPSRPPSMRIAFYAPLKPPTYGTPSGDRRVAGLLMDALARAGQRVELVSTFRSFDGDGDAERQGALRSQGEALGRTLAAQ